MGAGGMGAVYRGRDTALNRFVAVKVMKAALGEDAKLVESFIREAQAAAALNHPNIVQIYSCGQEKGQPYIVMELVTGGRMNQMFSATEPMDEIKLLKIAIDVAEGLKAANDVGLVHGDIKPENILIDNAGTAKIVDFGLAQFVNAQKDRGEIWGTPYYISPERARGNKADHRSDIYSLGATMFHALTGRAPFDGETAVDVVLARLKHPPPEIKTLRPELGDETVVLVNRMMAADPFLRHPNSLSLKSDMSAALSAAKAARKKTQHPHKKASKSSRIIAGVAAAAVIGIGIGVYSWHRAEKARPTPVETKKTKAGKDAAAQPDKPPERDNAKANAVVVTGPDGIIRTQTIVTVFSPAQEVKIVDALSALGGPDVTEAYRKLDAAGRGLPRNSPDAAWIPLLQALPMWAAGDIQRADVMLDKALASAIRGDDNHPGHMPQILARWLRGKISAEDFSAYRQAWPAWFGDLANGLAGVRELALGNRVEGLAKLAAYGARVAAGPAWVYAFQSSVEDWIALAHEEERLTRQTERLIAADRLEAARDALLAFQKSAPPMLAKNMNPRFQLIAERENKRAEQAALIEARSRRLVVQEDLDRVDAALAELSSTLTRQRDFQRASLSLSALPSAMVTEEGKAAAIWLHDMTDRLKQLKEFIIRGIEVAPFTRADGSDLNGDVVSANALGVRVTLDGRTTTTVNWDAIPVRSFVRLAEFYVQHAGLAKPDRAEALVSLSLFGLIHGAYEPAAAYARQAVALDPDVLPLVRRFLPGLLGDG
jgi:serine/threonine protein kinase